MHTHQSYGKVILAGAGPGDPELVTLKTVRCLQQASLYDYEGQWKGKTFISPSLVIIGIVVQLHEQFKWLTNSHNREHYFKPLARTFTTIPYSDKAENVKHHVSRA